MEFIWKFNVSIATASATIATEVSNWIHPGRGICAIGELESLRVQQIERWYQHVLNSENPAQQLYFDIQNVISLVRIFVSWCAHPQAVAFLCPSFKATTSNSTFSKEWVLVAPRLAFWVTSLGPSRNCCQQATNDLILSALDFGEVPSKTNPPRSGNETYRLLLTKVEHSVRHWESHLGCTLAFSLLHRVEVWPCGLDLSRGNLEPNPSRLEHIWAEVYMLFFEGGKIV